MNGENKNVENVVVGRMIPIGTGLKWIVSINIFKKKTLIEFSIEWLRS